MENYIAPLVLQRDLVSDAMREERELPVVDPMDMVIPENNVRPEEYTRPQPGSDEETYGVMKAPDSPLMARAAEMFRGVERRLEGSPAEFMLPGGGIAQVLERKAYGEDPSAFEYGMAGLDAIDIVPGAGTAVGTGGQVLLGAAMAGPKAVGKVGDQIKKALELFGKKRDEMVKKETGVIRTLENQPGFAIPSMGEGGTKLKEDAVNEVTRAFERRNARLNLPIAEQYANPASKASDYIDWPFLYQAYPEAANIPVEIIDRDAIPEGIRGPYFHPDTQTIYMPARVSGDYRAVRPYLNEKELQVGMTQALAQFVDATEGRLRSKGLDEVAILATPETKALRAAEQRAYKEKETGPISPQRQFELAKQRYPGEVQRATTSDVYTMRSEAIGRPYGDYGSEITDENKIREQITDLQNAYANPPVGRFGRRPLGSVAGEGETYPLELGDKFGDLPSLYSYETSTFESPLLSKVGALKQEKGSGDQFLGALKKTNPNPEDLQYSGLETYLTGRKNVTKDEITEYLTERAIPLQRKDTTFFNQLYVVEPFAGTKFKTGSEHSNPNTLEIITRTDPISGVPASRGAFIPKYHERLSPNVIAWARYNERLVENPATGDSFDALFIDEIQSDWHQRGKKVADAKHAQLAEDTYPEMASEVKKEGRIKFRNGDFAEVQDDGGLVDQSSAQLLWEKNEMRKRTPELREQVLKDAYNPSEGGVPDAPFKKNWHELTLREVFREAIANGHDGVALSTNAMQSRKYNGRKFNFYDGPLRSYMSKFAKRYGSKVETYELPQIQIEDVPGNFLGTRKPVKAEEQTKGQEVFYMPITDEMREWAKTPVSTYARGGGVQSLSPIAKNMFRGYDDVKRGVGSYMPHIRYSRRS
jgi:hypothetical protein